LGKHGHRADVKLNAQDTTSDCKIAWSKSSATIIKTIQDALDDAKAELEAATDKEKELIAKAGELFKANGDKGKYLKEKLEEEGSFLAAYAKVGETLIAEDYAGGNLSKEMFQLVEKLEDKPGVPLAEMDIEKLNYLTQELKSNYLLDEEGCFEMVLKMLLEHIHSMVHDGSILIGDSDPDCQWSILTKAGEAIATFEDKLRVCASMKIATRNQAAERAADLAKMQQAGDLSYEDLSHHPNRRGGDR